jgi:hypothetical protein
MIIFILVFILTTVCFQFISYHLKSKRNLRLIFSDWNATLELWGGLNKLLAAKSKVDVDSLYEEALRNICVQEKIQRVACNEK